MPVVEQSSLPPYPYVDRVTTGSTSSSVSAACGCASKSSISWSVRGTLADRRTSSLPVSRNESSMRTPMPAYFLSAGPTSPEGEVFGRVGQLLERFGADRSQVRSRTPSRPRAAACSRRRRGRPCQSSAGCRACTRAELRSGRVGDQAEPEQPLLDDRLGRALDVQAQSADARPSCRRPAPQAPGRRSRAALA